MTFEEWLKTQPILSDSHIRIARLAWEEGYDQGVADSDPAVHIEDPAAGLPGMGDYTYEEFSKDCDRW